MVSQFDEFVSLISNYNAWTLLFILGTIIFLLFFKPEKMVLPRSFFAILTVVFIASIFSNFYFSNFTSTHICQELLEDRSGCLVFKEGSRLNSDGKLEIYVYREKLSQDVFLIGKKQYSDKKMRKRENIVLELNNTWSENGLTQLLYQKEKIKEIITKYQSYDKDFEDSRKIRLPAAQISAK